MRSFWGRLDENIAMAIATLRASKMRSALTILGVVIGISTVMAMATLVNGIQRQIVGTIEVAGPTTFYVMKAFSQTPVNPDALPAWIRIRPDLSRRDAQVIAALPEVSFAALWAQHLGRLEYKGMRSGATTMNGADDRFQEIYGGELILGRWFTKSELRNGASVVVLNENNARRLFGRENPLGKWIRVGGRPAEVIGLWAEPQNVFAPPGADNGVIMPFETMWAQFPIDKTNTLYISVKPRSGVSVDSAQAAVTVALREARKLRPAQKNNFDLITQDQILDIFTALSGAFFLVMMVLSSVGLLVGGIGVMAIMMVSVTSRTREIGVRKALGASRRDIMTQFLIEASTLTGIGGFFGILAGIGVGQVIAAAMSIEAPLPVAQTIVAVLVSVAVGVFFGLVPARRAARLDPVEALRYE
ncbi:MAG TPA: ABC transporter permease [Gemmatimonadaceae bacterium]|nr:ABC transporter permease [Gemmatimonadaceae bacterium]